MNRTASQSSFYSTTRDETDVILLQGSTPNRWSTSFLPDDASSGGSSPESPPTNRRTSTQHIESGDGVKLAGSRPSSLYVPRGEKLSPARRSFSADAEPQVWRERERHRSEHEGSDDESTPLVGASPLVSPLGLTPTAPRPIIITRQATLPSDPETTL